MAPSIFPADAPSGFPSDFPTVLVLASGRGERFLASGGSVHKLHADLNGKPVLQHTLDSVRASGLLWHVEDAGHPGMGDSIAAAVRATASACGWLVLPGDLPLIQPGTLRRVAAQLHHHHHHLPHAEVIVPIYQGMRGHPVGFSWQCLDELLALSGDFGAVSVVRAHRMDYLEVNDPGVTTDVDTVPALERARMMHLGRSQADPAPP